MGLFAKLGAIPPDSFYSVLLAFHAFPLHSPLTLFGIDAPWGRFAPKSSILNLNGNLAWACMEIVAPTTLLTTLYRLDRPPLSAPSVILAGMYVCHYIHRAILSPLVLSPKKSPVHLVVPLSAMLWNLTNASLLGMQLSFFPPTLSLSSPKFWLGVLGWAVGLAGNIYHDEILNDLRRPREKRLILKLTPEEERQEKQDKEKSGGRYAIPRGAGFQLVAFPNYTCEWFEWLCYALIAGPLTVAVPPLNRLHFGQTTVKVLNYLPFWPTRLLSPGSMFLVAELAAMIPRAVRTQAWYRRTFGNRYPKDRKIVIPWLF